MDSQSTEKPLVEKLHVANLNVEKLHVGNQGTNNNDNNTNPQISFSQKDEEEKKETEEEKEKRLTGYFSTKPSLTPEQQKIQVKKIMQLGKNIG